METTETHKMVMLLEEMLEKGFPSMFIYHKFIDFYAIVNFMLMEIKHAEHIYSQVKSNANKPSKK